MLVASNAKISIGKGNETRLVHILIQGETIHKIVPATDPIPPNDEVIDASGLLVLPGAIDPHVHFNTPGYTFHEDFTHGSMSAAAGGVTCVIDMPDTSIPPVTDQESFSTKLKVISQMSVIDFGLWGGVSGNALRESGWHNNMRVLKEEGAVGLKCYLLSSMHTFQHLMPLELVDVMGRAAELGMLVGLHAEDRDVVQRRTEKIMAQGRQDIHAYYESRRDPAESDGMKQGATIAKETACSLHIVHVGSAAGADFVTEVRKDGADITMETCAHYLAFSHKDMEERGAILKTSPVIKTKDDSKRLWQHLSEGNIDFLASDHAPCAPDEKETGNVWTDYSGISGTELVLPYALSEGFAKGRIDLSRLVNITSTNAAKRFGLYPRKGALEVGSDADLVFVDSDRKWTVRGADFKSKGKFTPFEGVEFTGKVVRTMCRGVTVFEEGRGILAKPGFGQFIRRD
ncbi:MAG: allantoinase AllB [Pseudomonadota bacterium]